MSLIPGCYVRVPHYGKVVFLAHGETPKICNFRYPAIRCSDNKLIWVFSSCPTKKCLFLKKPNKKSLEVLKLRGIYGDE